MNKIYLCVRWSKVTVVVFCYRTVEIFFCWLKFQDTGHLLVFRPQAVFRIRILRNDPYVFFLNFKNMKK
jgi:hypothetical protein